MESNSYRKIYTLYYLIVFTISLVILEIPYVEAGRRLTAVAQGPHYEFAAVGVVTSPGTRVYGGRAVISVWEPAVSRDADSSSAYIQISLNTSAYMGAGWIVYPERYGDFKPRLYIYWTADGGLETGCLDLDCEGFQLLDELSPIGQLIEPISDVGGSTWVIDVLIYQISSSGDWQLDIGGKPIGYWPASLFSNTVGAREVTVGGRVFDSVGNSVHTDTDMGNGLFPTQDDASSICSIEYVDASFTRRIPDRDMLVSYVNDHLCYDARLLPVTNNVDGVCILFGGSGRNVDCP
ncbi:protein neprosin-like [Silene latifolia]|uniref:protein neprosin-like n=1 Tax=Silene latifolia TaxID=37657 RepID=UPI003D771D1E